MLTECLLKVGKQISSVDREDIENSYNEHLKTKSEYDAAISALGEYHKALFDETNDLRSQVGLKPVEYKPVSNVREKGFAITGQTGPEATSAIGKLKEQRDTARREADTDPLTGIANRRALDRALPAAEKDPNTSVISFDANNFGQINKKLGEVAGDKALKEIADAFKQAADENNTGARVFRRGGDEFVMLAPKEKAEAIRDRAEQLYGEKKYGDTSVSVSGTVGDNFEEANAKLQAAKAERKSRATLPADGTQNTEPASKGNNQRESTSSEQGTSGRAEANGGQGTAETQPADTGQAEGQPGTTIKSEPIKPTGKVFTERGTEAQIETRTIPRDQILTSLDEGYPAELQPRDRSRAASKDQINEISGKLNPELLGDSPKASDGRPLVVPVDVNGETKYAVVSGNGRTEAIRNARGDNATAYDDFVKSKGGNAGDMYVGVLDPKTDLEKFAREANESSTAKMSATEQAQADSKDLDLSNFTPSDDGSIHTGANRDFIRKFMEKLPASERGDMMLPDGTLSQTGANRIRNAVFARAYGGTETGLAVIQRMAESTDNNVKRITSALLQNAPAFADLKEGIDSGSRHEGLDITGDISKAVEKFSFLRENGDNVTEYLKQQGLFGEDLTPFQKRMLQVLDETKNSAKALSGILKKYIDLANAEGDPKQIGMFGEPSDVNGPTLFREAVIQYGDENGRQQSNSTERDLFSPDKGGEVQRETGASRPEETPQETKGAANAESAAAQADKAESQLESPSYGSGNKIVTQDKAEAARELLRKKLGGSETTLFSGFPLDPDVLKAAAQLATYHIEAGARTFAEFSKRMIADIGDAIKPHLRDLYNQIYLDRGFEGMQPPTPEEIQVTGIKKAIDENERQTMGFADAPKVERETFEDAKQRAAERIQQDPFIGKKLVTEILNKPRALNPEETMVLLHYKRSIDNVYNEAVRGINEGYEQKDQAKIDENTTRLNAISDERQNLMDAGRLQGTEKGRGLNIQKALMKEDYSLASLEAQKRAANGGRPLTDEERTHLQGIADDFAKKNADLEDRIKERELELMGLKESTPNPRVIQVAEQIVKKLNARADAARERLKSRGAIFTSGVDPVALKDLAEIGASHIANVGLDFAKWSEKMIGEFGEKIKPHLQKIYEASNNIVGGIEPNAREQIFKPKTPEEIAGKIAEKIKGGKDDAVSGLIQRLAKELVKNGVKDRDTLITKIHDMVKDAIPERRDVMDAISGYGKFKQLSKGEVDVTLRDLKGQMQQIAKIEDMQAGQAPAKTGVERRTPSDEERRLLQQVNEEKRKGGYTVTDPATQLRTALAAAKTRLQNSIKDLEDQIAKKQKNVKQKSSLQYDQEANDLKTRRDELKKQFDEVFGKQGLTDEQRLRNWKNRTQKRISDLNEKLMTGDFSKKAPVKPIGLDPEATQMKIDVERLKRQFERELRADQMKRRPLPEKALDLWAKYVRAGMLSWPTTLGKLTNAAMGRMVLNPVEEGIKTGIAKVTGIDKTVPTSSVAIEAKAVRAYVTQGMKDAWQMLRNKDSNLDVLAGKEKYDHTPLEWFGQLHGALKAPVKRAAFERSLQKQIEFGLRNGEDVHDPLVQMKYTIKAYEDASRDIFMQDNRLVNAYKSALNRIEAPDPKTGKVNLGGKAVGTAARTLFPIIKIPLNYIGETTQYAVGSVTGSVKLGMAFRKGLENVSTAEKEQILRHLSKGSLGAGAMLLGFFNPQAVGGYYQQGEKRDPQDVKASQFRLFGVDIPQWASHIPILEVVQLGATIRRVADSKFKKADDQPKGLSTGAMAGALGLAEEAPFVKETIDMAKLMDPKERANFAGEFAKSRVVPGLVQWMANKTDTKDGVFSDTIKRKPASLWEHIETGIPGLRQNVLSKGEAMDIKTASTDDMVDAIKEIRSQKKDSTRYEKELIKKAENAQKGRTLTRDEVDRIKEVIPNFNLAPRVRKVTQH